VFFVPFPEEILDCPTIRVLTVTGLFSLYKVGRLFAVSVVLKISEGRVGDVIQGFHSEEGLVPTVRSISIVLGINGLGCDYLTNTL